ncbi:MAG: hypothetical protein ACI835_000328 [Planctomycetota bacterium]|jgi:hypothetical protein
MRKARVAFDGIQGVDRLFQNGGAAVLTLKSGAKLEEATIKSLLKKQGLSLVSFKKEEREYATRAYSLNVKPVT